MAPRLSEQTSLFGGVFFVSKSLLGIKRKKNPKRYAILTRKPGIDVRIFIDQTWSIGCGFEVSSRILNFIVIGSVPN